MAAEKNEGKVGDPTINPVIELFMVMDRYNQLAQRSKNPLFFFPLLGISQIMVDHMNRNKTLRVHADSLEAGSNQKVNSPTEMENRERGQRRLMEFTWENPSTKKVSAKRYRLMIKGDDNPETSGYFFTLYTEEAENEIELRKIHLQIRKLFDGEVLTRSMESLLGDTLLFNPRSAKEQLRIQKEYAIYLRSTIKTTPTVIPPISPTPPPEEPPPGTEFNLQEKKFTPDEARMELSMIDAWADRHPGEWPEITAKLYDHLSAIVKKDIDEIAAQARRIEMSSVRDLRDSRTYIHNITHHGKPTYEELDFMGRPIYDKYGRKFKD